MSDGVRILRLKRTDVKDEHLLLRVTQKNATRPLDLSFIATDQEHIYHGGIKTSQVGKLKAELFTGDDDELRDILLHSFMQHHPDGVPPDTLQGLETVSSIAKETVTITVRKNIGGITQRIALVTLVQDDEREEISPFGWVEEAVVASDELRTELSTLQASISTQQNEIKALKSRLEEFIEAKREHDEDLLIKFAALLNAKKQKIRDLTYGVTTKDEDAMDEDEPAVNNRKRKADSADVDNEIEEQDKHETPDDTEDERSGDEEEAVPPDTKETRAQSDTTTAAELPPPIKPSLPRRQKAQSEARSTEQDDEETDDEL